MRKFVDAAVERGAKYIAGCGPKGIVIYGSAGDIAVDVHRVSQGGMLPCICIGNRKNMEFLLKTYGFTNLIMVDQEGRLECIGVTLVLLGLITCGELEQ